MAMIVPQKAAPSMPATQKPRPASVPWMMPITTVPLMVARVTEVSRSSKSHFVFVTQRHVIENFLDDLLAVAKEEKHRVKHDEEIEQKRGCSGGELWSRPRPGMRRWLSRPGPRLSRICVCSGT